MTDNNDQLMMIEVARSTPLGQSSRILQLQNAFVYMWTGQCGQAKNTVWDKDCYSKNITQTSSPQHLIQLGQTHSKEL